MTLFGASSASSLGPTHQRKTIWMEYGFDGEIDI
jgi:hypothetical protein